MSKAKLRNRPSIANLKYNDGTKQKITETHQEKAEVLSNFFNSVFTIEKEQDKIQVEQKQYKEELSNIEIKVEDIFQILSKIRIDKTPGPDGIHPRLLKETSIELSIVLCKIFNTSIKTGKLPKDWKQAHISAIFKKGDNSIAGNYRPVSLTCIACKIIETLIRKHIIDHMKDNQLFSQAQYGFIKGRSTGLQLIKVLDLWTDIIDSGGELDVIYLDFMKAFDSVPHRRLISKLGSYGIKGEIIEWVQDFLIGRQQRVGVMGQFSRWSSVHSGIPQGSVLGPLLFVIYINDLPVNIKSHLFMFADDTKVFRQIKNENDHKQLQEDLTEMEDWSNKWLLRFHPEKCKVMNVSRKKSPNKRIYNMTNSQNNNIVELEQTEVEKDLGLNIDNSLTFEYHLNE